MGQGSHMGAFCLRARSRRTPFGVAGGPPSSRPRREPGGRSDLCCVRSYLRCGPAPHWSRAGRRALLIEIDRLHCDVMVQRWEQLPGRKAKRERVAGQKRAPATSAGATKEGT
jgi:hypothetical protein